MKNFKDKIGSKYTPKRTIKKYSRGSMPPNPLCKAHGFASGMQISKSEKKFFAPPHLKSWLRPCIAYIYSDIPRLAPMWQYFGTITCDGLHGIMKLYIESLINHKSEFSAPLQTIYLWGTIFFQKMFIFIVKYDAKGVILWLQNYQH